MFCNNLQSQIGNMVGMVEEIIFLKAPFPKV